MRITTGKRGARSRGARNRTRLAIAAGSIVAVTTSGCAFQGVNSLPLPGAVGRGSDALVYHAEIGNVATLEPNSPVMLNDVVVGSVRKMSVKNWHADVEFSVKPDIAVPANVVASVGQTSLLGSMHLALNTPLGQPAGSALTPGATIELDKSSTYPTTERTLSSLATVVNGGGLGQIGDVIHNFSLAMNGREGDFRQLLTRLDDFVGVMDAQSNNLVSSIRSLDKLASTFAGQRDVISDALVKIPPALDVLIKERPQFVTALQKLGTFSQTTHELANESQDDLVRNLSNLIPVLEALANVGPELPDLLEFIGHFPFTQGFLDRAVKGDYLNLFATFDLTISRFKRSMMLGTRWQDQDTTYVPTYGDPAYLNYTYDPLRTGVKPPAADGTPSTTAGAAEVAPAQAQTTANSGPLLPVVPPTPVLAGVAPAATPGAGDSIFAGPYGNGG